MVGEGKERSLVPNEHEQEVLRHAQSMRKQGATLRAIAAEVAQDYGIQTLDPKTLQRMLNRQGVMPCPSPHRT